MTSAKAWKIGLISSATLSGISVFVPIYAVNGYGVSLSIPKEFSQDVILMPTFYGVGILLSAIAIILLALGEMRKGYAVASVFDAVVSLVGLAVLSGKANSDPRSLISEVGTALNTYEVQEVVTRPGFYLVIVTVVLVLGTMLFNFMRREEEE